LSQLLDDVGVGDVVHERAINFGSNEPCCLLLLEDDADDVVGIECTALT